MDEGDMDKDGMDNIDEDDKQQSVLVEDDEYNMSEDDRYVVLVANEDDQEG